ncbi:hypothetical protein QR680_006853 [Steinernema hermaphroditum]|uniref:Uncharacterized protein n=1 Tax=Steinernema hermaphroditum TaxID=289476 RepID=A0AA39LY30_9BILA|nr:hypothetical protein QR680_006853 [Steinernema hermaphroditum]
MHFCATLYIPNNLHVTVLEQFFRRETIEMVTLDNSLYRFFLRSDRDVDTICKTQGECRCFHCNDIHETQDDFSEHVMETHSAAALVSFTNSSALTARSTFPCLNRSSVRQIASDCSMANVDRTLKFKKFYNYVIVDPTRMPPPENCSFYQFLTATIYISKGEGSRCYDHLLEAAAATNDAAMGIKVRLLRSVYVAAACRGSSSPEALMREHAMISLFPDRFLTNGNRGENWWHLTNAIDPANNQMLFTGYGILCLVRIYQELRHGYMPEIGQHDLGR